MEYELVHYGVKGIRWGVRKKRETSDILANVQRTKAAYKSANKQYSKDFDNAYNRSIAAWSPSKKHRAANDARWEKAAKSAEATKKAQGAAWRNTAVVLAACGAVTLAQLYSR